MSGAIAFSVPGNFTNTGLCISHADGFAIGDFDSGRIVLCDYLGAFQSAIILASAPATSLQGVSYDAGRGNYWGCHQAATNGTIRRYDLTGALQQTISPALSINGPSGLVYDSSIDTLITVWTDGKLRVYSASTGSLSATITLDGALGTGSGAGPDGVTLDPVDTAALWVSVDMPYQKIVKVNRTTGASISSFSCASSAEGLAWYDGYLYMCADKLYHEAVPSGNRVYRYNSAGQGVAFHMPEKTFQAMYTP